MIIVFLRFFFSIYTYFWYLLARCLPQGEQINRDQVKYINQIFSILLPVMLIAMAFHFYKYRNFISFDYLTYLGLGVTIGIFYTTGKNILMINNKK